MQISNAFETITKKGHKVFRIEVDTNEILSFLEQGKTKIRYDIMTKNGIIQARTGVGKNGKPYRALHYYTWAMSKDEPVNTALPQQAGV